MDRANLTMNPPRPAPAAPGLDWREVDGWLSPEEGAALADLARGKVVLELGSYKGRATLAMAATAERVVTVDWHQGDLDIWRDRGRHDTSGELAANLERAGYNGRVEAVISKFEALDDEFLSQGFDLVFIDGAHDAASVERDARIALKTGAAVIAFHDANYPTVLAGAMNAGLDLRPVAGSLAVAEPKRPAAVETPRVALAMPRYGPAVHPSVNRAFWHDATGGEVEIVAYVDACQSIVYAFNAALAQALDWRDEGRCTHFAMQHADVVPTTRHWLDVLWGEMRRTRADIVSTVIPIKDAQPNPRTSTAIGDVWNPWFPLRYIHVNDRGRMPETFGPKDVCGPDEVLLLNTGLWIADLRKPWWDYFNWNLESRIVRHEGKRKIQMRSEDWEMSRFLQAHGAECRATWKVRVKHYGEFAWDSHLRSEA